MKVRITAEAERDLEGIGDYIAQDNLQRALSFIEELREKCLSLADAPLAFPLVQRYESHVSTPTAWQLPDFSSHRRKEGGGSSYPARRDGLRRHLVRILRVAPSCCSDRPGLHVSDGLFPVVIIGCSECFPQRSLCSPERAVPTMASRLQSGRSHHGRYHWPLRGKRIPAGVGSGRRLEKAPGRMTDMRTPERST